MVHFAGVDMDSQKKFQTKEQLIHRIQEGLSFGDGEDYCVSDYLEMAQAKMKDWVSKNRHTAGGSDKPLTPEDLENCYWDTVEINNDEYNVE